MKTVPSSVMCPMSPVFIHLIDDDDDDIDVDAVDDDDDNNYGYADDRCS